MSLTILRDRLNAAERGLVQAEKIMLEAKEDFVSAVCPVEVGQTITYDKTITYGKTGTEQLRVERISMRLGQEDQFYLYGTSITADGKDGPKRTSLPSSNQKLDGKTIAELIAERGPEPENFEMTDDDRHKWLMENWDVM